MFLISLANFADRADFLTTNGTNVFTDDTIAVVGICVIRARMLVEFVFNEDCKYNTEIL